MGAYGLVEKDTMAYGSGTWVRTHDAWVLWEEHGMIRMLLTGCMIRVCQYWTYECGQYGTRSWLGVDRRGRRSSKRVDCDILTQGLIGLIEYSYHQGVYLLFQKPN
jgi:hypothetical protein